MSIFTLMFNINVQFQQSNDMQDVQICAKVFLKNLEQLGIRVCNSSFLSQNDSASILSGDACPQDYKTIKIIFVASVLGVPQDTTFL